ncbi:MAG TPA: hypothetical protein VK425_06625 [Acidimicrobiales bacterium]|nr:hypothetical protein [Acidimicrobiales bacterium]
MRRKTFDSLMTAAGFVLTAVLLVAGALLLWGYNYANNTVTTQLAAQQIYFPPASAFAHPTPPEITPAMKPYLLQYAGQELTTGAQAEAYANHFIAIHLEEIGGGKTYSQLSAESLAQPNNTALAAEVQLLFRGTTLRSMLLNAYGWWRMGQIALVGAIVSFILGGLMLVLSIFGLWHARKVAPTAEI